VHILNSEQVEYCQVVRQTEDKSEIIPGVAYNNKLFIKIASYDLDRSQNAIDRARSSFLEHKGLVMLLVIRGATDYTIWIEDKTVQLPPADPLSIDLKTLVADLLAVGGLEIKDRRHKLKTYPRCFVGSEAVEWMKAKLNISTTDAIQIGQKLIEAKWIHHVTNEHQFENDYLFYRFSETKLSENADSQDRSALAIDLDNLVAKMRNIGGVKIKDRRHKLKTYPRCFVGSEAVEWIAAKLNISTTDAIQIGQKLIDEKLIHHVTNEHQFENDYLFYRFYWDD